MALFVEVLSFAYLGANKSYELKHTEDAMYVKVEMPGVSKENVKVYLDGKKLVIKGVEEPETEVENDKETTTPGRSYSAYVYLKKVNEYKTTEIKAGMKDGLLKVKVPKFKLEEREDVVFVQVN